jgi:hypothetical protein
MLRINRLLTMLLLVTLILGACQPLRPVTPGAQPAPATESILQPHVPRVDAPPFGLRGPYAVGVRDLVIEPTREGDRTISVTVWYPALNPDNQPEYTTYLLDFKNPNFADFAIGGAALRNAEPDGGGGPYPLVIYSHGLTLFRQVSSYLTEHLASWGFVVIAGDHQDNWGTLTGESHSRRCVGRIDRSGSSGGDGPFIWRRDGVTDRWCPSKYDPVPQRLVCAATRRRTERLWRGADLA